MGSLRPQLAYSPLGQGWATVLNNLIQLPQYRWVDTGLWFQDSCICILIDLSLSSHKVPARTQLQFHTAFSRKSSLIPHFTALLRWNVRQNDTAIWNGKESRFIAERHGADKSVHRSPSFIFLSPVEPDAVLSANSLQCFSQCFFEVVKPLVPVPVPKSPNVTLTTLNHLVQSASWSGNRTQSVYRNELFR